MRLITLLRQPSHRQRIVVEAAGELIRAWAIVRFGSFPRYAGSLGTPSPGEAPQVGCVASSDIALMRDTRWAIDALNRTVRGRFTCLMNAMAIQRMLNRRGIPSGLVLGAKITRGGAVPVEGLAAHAWLWAGGVIVVGGEERGGFVPLTTYLSGQPHSKGQ